VGREQRDERCEHPDGKNDHIEEAHMDIEQLITRVLPEIVTILRSELQVLTGPHTWYQDEAQTHAIMQRVGQCVAQALAEQEGSGLQGPSRPCAQCGGEQVYHDQHHPLTMLTSVGAIHWTHRAAYRCPVCHRSSYPLDERLGLRHAGRTSRYLQELLGWLLAEEPIATACETLHKFLGVHVPVSQMRRVGEALGAELDAQQAHRVEQVTQETQGLSASTPVRQPPETERVQAAPDGWMYCTTARDEQGGFVWREAKTLAVAEAAPGPASDEPDAAEQRTTRQRIAAHLPPPVRPADQPRRLSYVVRTQGSWQEAGAWFWAEVHERGVGSVVTDLAVLADGGEGLSQMVESHLRQRGIRLTRILDIRHAQQHLWEVARLLESDQRAWLPDALEALEQGTVAALLALLAEVAASFPAATQAATTAQAYFDTRFRQIDYPSFVQQGYPIGSGLAESACKRFGTDRMKGTGMRWTPAGAQSIATLRALRLSQRWKEVSALCAAA
jgi:hypothetical protein